MKTTIKTKEVIYILEVNQTEMNTLAIALDITPFCDIKEQADGCFEVIDSQNQLAELSGHLNNHLKA